MPKPNNADTPGGKPIKEKDPAKKQFHARKLVIQALVTAKKSEVTKAMREIKRLGQRATLSAEFKEAQETKLSARLAWLREADGELLVSHVLPPQPTKTPPAKLEGVAAGIMNKLRNVADVKTKREAYLVLLGGGDAE